MKEVTTHPNSAERMVITANALIAAKKTVSLLLVIAMMAAMKKVLSPISETIITDKDSTKPCKNPTCLVTLNMEPGIREDAFTLEELS